MTVSLAAGPAAAQLAPTGGHYADRASDTGFAGAVNSSGGYGASVPLDLPAARGGLPVPVAITYGDRGVGAAGLGFDVPLSYVRRDQTVAHRRPLETGSGGPQPRERVTLVMGGSALELVKTASGWVARRDSPETLLREQNGTWVMFDGQGRTYTFTTVSSAVNGANLWLLKTITGVGGSRVELDYNITTPMLPGGAGLSIDLTTVSYNPSPTTANCFKNSVVLHYDASAASPLSLSVLGDRVLARMDKVDAVNVNSKATCSDAYVRLRHYELAYQQDVDTKQPRLHSVQVFGRDGTTEATTPITVATYGYGTATSGGQLRYTRSGQAASGFVQAYTKTYSIAGPPGSGTMLATFANLIDLSGDGLPDLIKYDTNTQQLTMVRDWLHSMQSVSLGDGTPQTPIETRSLQQQRYQGSSNVDRTWQQAIDVNGDGRIDRIDAAAEPGRWVVYLNTPNPADPGLPTWERRTYSVQQLRTQLIARGFALDDPDHVPLAQRTTMRQVTAKTCWFWDTVSWVQRPQGFLNGQCVGPPVTAGTERTFTDWEFTDINNDGYPDVVFNSSPVIIDALTDPDPDPPADPTVMQYTTTTSVTTPTLPSSNEIDAMFNIAGVHFGSNTQPFSAVAVLRSNDSCGVGRWDQFNDTIQELSCGIVDVNGDGLPDRVVGLSVYLGTGSVAGSAFFTTGARLTLPGAPAVTRNPQTSLCSHTSTTTEFTAYQTAGMRDLTGDGIPDYVTVDGLGGGSVQIGTGTGYLPAIPMTGMSNSLSTQLEKCDGTISTTTSGLYDIDGDGKADMLSGDGSVYQLVGNGIVGAPEAGRLVTIDNGFGAVTTITYGAAKVLASSSSLDARHQVPFPEVVVVSVQTSTPEHTERGLAAVQYAYGGAQLIFDPVADRFVFPGYHRRVTLRVPTEAGGQQEGLATITDTYVPLDTTDPFDLATASLTADQRYTRRLRIGRVSDVTVLAGDLGTDPTTLLSKNALSDTHRISSTHYEWGARLLTAASDPAGPEACSEMVYPYNFGASQAFAVDACRQRGFGFMTSAQSFRGGPGADLSSGATVSTRSEVRTIDDLGRVLSVKQRGDLARPESDVCIDTTYAAPTGQNERVLMAASVRAVGDCDKITYAKDQWFYDKQALGKVSAGLPTTHIVERRDELGNLLGAVREFDATFTPEANPVTVTTKREDGANRTVSVTYDPSFALAPVIIATTATGVPKQRVDLTLDPLTLAVVNARDPNGTLRGTKFDGFDRPTMATVTPPGGAEGALSCTSFLGFAGNEPDGRRVSRKMFTKALTPSTACAAAGRTSTVFLDELGRANKATIDLGANHDNQQLIAGHRSYDSFGRVVFEADPYPSTQSFDTAYGTTQFIHSDGTSSCTVRGAGRQAAIPATTDEIHEIYPTCIERTFQDSTEIVTMRDAASYLTSSPQERVRKVSYATAIGRVLARATFRDENRLEYATFSYDRLGHGTGMTRYQDAAGATKPVTSSWHYDSIGWLLELDEPDSSPRFYTYSNWGDLLKATRGPSAGAPPTAVVAMIYDALGRVTHKEQQLAGVVDPETVNDYEYDQPVNVAPQVTPTNMLGRLALATSPTGAESFSYDSFGQINARVFTDNQGGTYVEKHTFNDDGSLESLDLFLPDTGFDPEHVAYTYDSAGHGDSVTYSTGVNHENPQTLYTASQIDAFGRVRQAQYGLASYAATYADVGRRLPSQVTVSSMSGSRDIQFPGFDPLRRERSRVETKNGGTATTTSHVYDALGRLSSSTQKAGSTTLFNQQFAYDPLGNVVSLADSGPSAMNTTLSYLDIDRDRICRIAYGTGGDTACNVTYNEVGDITSMPTATGTRAYSYLADGSVRTISDEHATAHFRYDAFGAVQELELTASAPPFSDDNRHDRRYGDLIAWRDERPNGSSNADTVLLRKIPGPHGFLATRHGRIGPWTFAFGEARGGRFFTDQSGAFVQDLDYRPFGTTTSTGAQPGTTLYSSDHWNHGDALAAFGISKLGARLYDPAIGRFVSRDPLLIPRTAATTNPYAFADNDPVNGSDPSGLINTPGHDCADEACVTPNPTPPDAISGGDLDQPDAISGADPVTPPSQPTSKDEWTPTPAPPSDVPPPGRFSIDLSGGGFPGALGGPSVGSRSSQVPLRNDALARAMFGQAFDPSGLRQRYYNQAKKEAHEIIDPISRGVDTAVDLGLDLTPVIGTIRACYRSDVFGCVMGAASDLLQFAKIVRVARAVSGAGKASRLGRLGLAARELPEALRGGIREVHVYYGVTDEGARIYVGITKDLIERQAAHGARFELFQITTTPLTRGEARAVEEALITRNPWFQNARHEISTDHSWYFDALEWGEAWLQEHGL